MTRVTTGVRIGVLEFRRSVRAAAGKLTQLLGLAFGLMVFGGGAVVASYLLVSISPDLSGVTLGGTARSALAFQWLFATALLVQRVVTVHARPDAESFLFTTVRPTTALFGLVLAETLRAFAFVGVPLLVLGVAVASVAGSPLTPLLVLLALALFLASAVVTGHVLGLAAKLAVARVPALARNRTVFGVVAVLVLFGGYTVVQATGATTSGFGMLPVGWLVDLALLATPVETSLSHAVGGLALAAGWTLLGGLLAARIATAFWFGDSVEPAVEAEAAVVGRAGEDPLAAGLGRLAVPEIGSEPTRRVAQRSMLLARRAPTKLSYLVVPIAAVIPAVVNVAVGESTLPLGAVAPGLALLVPWLAGAAFALNPLGDEGRVLPMTLTAVASGRAYVAGLVLPALVVGLPFVVLTPIAALATGYGVLDTVLLAVACLLGVAIAALVAPGIGFLFPRTTAVRVVRGRELIPPTVTAMVCYSVLVGGFVGIPALAALAPEAARGVGGFIVGGLFAFPFDLAGGPGTAIAEALRGLARGLTSLSTPTVRWGGFALPLAMGLAVGALSVRLATRRFEGYTL